MSNARALLGECRHVLRRERRRVASYLHDGPVQELAGLAFSLAPVADSAYSRGAAADAAVVRRVIDRLRSTVRDLRALLVDLHPPTLASAGLDAAIRDLVSPLAATGTQGRAAGRRRATGSIPRRRRSSIASRRRQCAT